jgi:hypothetical protein
VHWGAHRQGVLACKLALVRVLDIEALGTEALGTEALGTEVGALDIEAPALADIRARTAAASARADRVAVLDSWAAGKWVEAHGFVAHTQCVVPHKVSLTAKAGRFAAGLDSLAGVPFVARKLVLYLAAMGQGAHPSPTDGSGQCYVAQLEEKAGLDIAGDIGVEPDIAVEPDTGAGVVDSHFGRLAWVARTSWEPTVVALPSGASPTRGQANL